MDLESVDFLSIRDVLLKASNGSDISGGGIKRIIDRELIEQNFYEKSFYHDEYMYRKKHGGDGGLKYRFKSSRFKFIHSVFETLECFDVISYSRTKNQHERFKTKYYNINDERTEYEVLEELLPEHAKSEIINLMKLITCCRNNGNIYQIYDIYKKISNNNVDHHELCSIK